MPEYDFINTVTGQIVPVFLGMNDDKVYSGPNGDQPGQWRRYWGTPPSAAVDSILTDPYSEKDFVKATAKSKGTMGELWDRAAELSEVRASKDGIDPLKQGYYDRFSRKRGGKKHPAQVREEAVRKLKERGINMEGDW